MQCFQLPRSSSLPIITTILNKGYMGKAQAHLQKSGKGRLGGCTLFLLLFLLHWVRYSNQSLVPLGVYCGKLGRRKAQNKHRISSWGLTFT